MHEDDNAINSAILTATITSLKLLKTIRQRQEAAIKATANQTTKLGQNQTAMTENLHALQKTQDQNLVMVQKILELPKPEEFAEIKASLAQLTQTLQTFDLKALRSQLQTDIQRSQSVQLASADKQTQQVLSAVADSNKADNVATIKQLIMGLTHMQKNIMELANRVLALSSNVNNVRSDSAKLSSTIMESNARIRSMDLRMAALTKTGMEADSAPKEYDNALQLLESVSGESTTTPRETAKSPLDELKAATREADQLDKNETGDVHDA